jgi:signal transduction histidine kinase
MEKILFFLNKQGFGLWRALLFAAGWAGIAWTHEHEKVNSVLEEDGRAFTFTVPGVLEFKGSFSAIVVSGGLTRELLSSMGQSALPGGQTQELHSAEGRLVAPVEHSREETPCGRATVTEVTLRFEQEHLDLLFRFSQVQGVPGFQAQAGIRNRGAAPVRLLSVTPVALEGRVAGKPTNWLVTLLDTSIKDAPAVVALSELAQPVSVFEYGGFYSAPDGNGFLFGPVGTPKAYVQASIAHKGEGKVAFAFTAEMSGVQVAPGETRWGQQVALFAEAPRKALARWSDWVAKTHKARTDKGALSGWNSYSFHGAKISGQDVLADVETVLKNPDRFRPMVMEIDTGYETVTDKTGANKKFLEGMPFYAQRIAATGARPGILLNFLGPPGFETTAGRIREMVQSGFTYLKINRTFLTLKEEAIPSKTSFEVMREGFMTLRQAAGEGTYLLYNTSRPDRATVGLMDANRTGVGSLRSSVRNAMTDVLRSYPLNNRWFAVDNDSYFMGTDIANVSEIAGGWPLVRTWMSMVGLSCGAALTSDPWHWESFRPYWRNVEVMSPPAREETMVLDLCTAHNWPRLVGHVKRAWGDQTVALLWNPGTAERNVTLDFARAGMNPKHRYAVWSFWDNRYMGVTRGFWKSPALGPSASQHLCFTDLDRSPDKPVLIGSTLHIYCGAAEIKRVSCLRGAMEIELTDAGAREGDLFIYSRRQPVWKAAQGCSVAEIASAGENVWRIHLVDRQSGAAQRVELAILLPVTRQIWFWALCGLLAASLLFALWRYFAYARLREQHALEQERARIARDIHDGLGVSLTQIAMRCEVMGVEHDIPSQLRGHVDEISRSAHALTRAADEIVWAVTPANDTAEKFVSFVGHLVESSLNAAGLSCRLELPSDVLDMPMSATVRYHLLLILKEALNNAIRHAVARTVTFSLVLEGRDMTITVTDDGCGFKTDNPFKPLAERVLGGNGLSNMRKRMAEIGGTLEIKSAPGQGTVLTLRVKL